jgi:hexosaminidase
MKSGNPGIHIMLYFLSLFPYFYILFNSYRMRTYNIIPAGSILLVAIIFAMHSCTTTPGIETNLSDHSIIPAPRELVATGEVFALNGPIRIAIPEGQDEIWKNGEILAVELESLTGMSAEVVTVQTWLRKGAIILRLSGDSLSYGEEGYGLFITPMWMLLEGATPAGVFRGIQTLLQVAEGDRVEVDGREDEWFIPTGEIRDTPEYAYRGTMLDVSRHFFSVEEVKRYIDLIALYKINHLHLHLSDDQGWRIEIKSWPKLTEIGGSTEVGGGEGGFYTQEEYREIMQYAQDRHITIVPEIDMPGHTNAALASYAELNCDGRARELYTGTRVGFSSLCTDKEITYEFVDDVVREIAEMTPGPYFHVGGDESHVTEHDDYVVFIERVHGIVRAHGKIMVGWDEITHAELRDSAVAQYWRHEENALRGIEQDMKIIMSPASRCYLDMKYDSTTELGLDWAGHIDLEKAYSWDPDTLVEGIKKEHILGIESPLWSETVTNIAEVEYMAFPRLIAHAEIGWSTDEERGFEGFIERLSSHYKMLDRLEVNYGR